MIELLFLKITNCSHQRSNMRPIWQANALAKLADTPYRGLLEKN